MHALKLVWDIAGATARFGLDVLGAGIVLVGMTCGMLCGLIEPHARSWRETREAYGAAWTTYRGSPGRMKPTGVNDMGSGEGP